MRHILSIILLLTSILISVADDNKELAQSNTGNQAHIGVTSDINIQANSKANAEVPRLDSLNKVLSHRQEYVGSKQRFIASLESRLKVASNDNDRLQALNELYNEYSTFRFDSAMVKVEQMMEIAQKANRKEYEALSNIYMANLLTTSGLFHEALGYLASIDRKTVPSQFLTDYYKAYEWTYSMLAEYADRSKFSGAYYAKELAYQDSIISTLNEGTPQYHYWKAEKDYRKGNIVEAQQNYQKAFSTVDVANRLYAQVAFGLALCAKALGDTQGYKDYLTLSSISDQVCPLKEKSCFTDSGIGTGLGEQ